MLGGQGVAWRAGGFLSPVIRRPGTCGDRRRLLSLVLAVGGTMGGLLLPARAHAALCDGAGPHVGLASLGGNTERITWTYDGPRDCTDAFNLRVGIPGKGEQQ